MVKKLRIREFSHKGGTLQLYMSYNKGAVDLNSEDVDIRVQLIQEGKSVQLNGQKSLKKAKKKGSKKLQNRIFYKETGR